MSGTVTDSSNAVVPDARIVLKDEAQQTVRESVSNGSGFFNFQAVKPGSYTLTVSASGFTTWEERNIPFTQGASVTIPSIVLQVGGTKSEVAVVAANDVIVPTDNGQASTTLNTHMITQLSIAGRDAAELIKIMPGMGFSNGLSQGSSFNPTTGTANNTGPIGTYSANGTQPYGAMTMTSDGANLLDPGNQGTQTANINADQTAEVTLLTSSYGAEFAKGPVTFQAIGKSGGAQFHGSGYFYERNYVMNAEDSYLKNQGIKPPQDHYYYPGGDFGGPVLLPWTKFNHDRNKLFFYSAFEYMWQQQAGALHNYFIPTADMMQNGNFSPAYLASLGTSFKNNYGGVGDVSNINNGSAGSLWPGGMIP
ncbi:MAG: carboxypeptidase-like regulatory domain-containing protein, partial [Bryobacteraceae bacterium]